MNERLYRSRDERVVGGVAGGIADYLAIDPTIVRVLWVVLAVLSGGAFLLIYLAMLVIVPEEPVGESVAAADTATGANPALTAGQDWRALRAAERARRREARARSRPRRAGGSGDDRGPIVFGLVLVVLGGWFLVREYIPELDLDRLWPLLLIGIGLAILLGSLRRGPAGPAGPEDPGAPGA